MGKCPHPFAIFCEQVEILKKKKWYIRDKILIGVYFQAFLSKMTLSCCLQRKTKLAIFTPYMEKIYLVIFLEYEFCSPPCLKNYHSFFRGNGFFGTNKNENTSGHFLILVRFHCFFCPLKFYIKVNFSKCPKSKIFFSEINFCKKHFFILLYPSQHGNEIGGCPSDRGPTLIKTSRGRL